MTRYDHVPGCSLDLDHDGLCVREVNLLPPPDPEVLAMAFPDASVPLTADRDYKMGELFTPGPAPSQGAVADPYWPSRVIVRDANGRPASIDPSEPDMVEHPPHYTAHPSGVECITITEHMGFNVGNAVKYLWRADEKGNALEDLRKAAWYVQREIERRQR